LNNFTKRQETNFVIPEIWAQLLPIFQHELERICSCPCTALATNAIAGALLILTQALDNLGNHDSSLDVLDDSEMDPRPTD